MKYFIWFLFFCLFSCSKAKNDKKVEIQKVVQNVIIIQPLGNFRRGEAKTIFTKIKAIHRKVILRQNIPFPENSYYRPRDRYRADSIIKNLKNKIGQDTVIVGLSHFDISTSKNKIQDWGVMGLGYKPGKACVVSNFRLSDKNKSQQFYKLVLHELGHTAGLPDCAISTCLMRDAEGKNPLDQEKDFCGSCKSFLKTKGWQLI